MPKSKKKIRTCRVCGCTDSTPCLTARGPCYWIEKNLCSACKGKNVPGNTEMALAYLIDALKYHQRGQEEEATERRKRAQEFLLK